MRFEESEFIIDAVLGKKAISEPCGSGTVLFPSWQRVEHVITRVGGVADDVASSLHTAFQVDILDGR